MEIFFFSLVVPLTDMQVISTICQQHVINQESLILNSLSKENGLFGVPLAVLLENDQKKIPGIKVPLIFQKVSGAN